jgi:hypothetical protein
LKFDVTHAETDVGVGSETTTLDVAEHPLASVTVAVWVPAAKPDVVVDVVSVFVQS